MFLYQRPMIVILFFLIFFTAGSAGDPLPSWNETPVKQRILAFVASVTNMASPQFVPRSQRIAAFDLDGTVILEKPDAAGVAFRKNLEEACRSFHGSNRGDEANDPCRNVLVNLTVQEYETKVVDFFENTPHPVYQVPYNRLFYAPMLELIDLLQNNLFQVYICSGSDVDFLHPISTCYLGLPKHRMIGSGWNYELHGAGLKRVEPAFTDNLGKHKVLNIHRSTGHAPILAVGNSDGDLEMMTYSHGRTGPTLQLLVVHDDALREYSYREGAEHVIAAAERNNWAQISMKTDFKNIFQPGVKR
ncbi:MAG: hypothetical protein QNK37_30100 [Acidobacteriota bacterium]|nr:hypothetical protein [Acidobacteriota bacterium]